MVEKDIENMFDPNEHKNAENNCKKYIQVTKYLTESFLDKDKSVLKEVLDIFENLPKNFYEGDPFMTKKRNHIIDEIKKKLR